MLAWFDPTNWNISYEDYRYGWFILVNTLFRGIWPKIIATLCLVFSVYSVIRRKFKPVLGLICFMAAVFFAYAGTIMNWVVE